MDLVRLKQEAGGYGYVYPIELLQELVKLRRNVRLLIAEWEGQIVGGGVFIRDRLLDLLFPWGRRSCSFTLVSASCCARPGNTMDL